MKYSSRFKKPRKFQSLKLALHDAYTDTDTDSDSPDTSIHLYVRYARFPRSSRGSPCQCRCPCRRRGMPAYRLHCVQQNVYDEVLQVYQLTPIEPHDGASRPIYHRATHRAERSLCLFHRRTRASYVYNGCLASYNVVLYNTVYRGVSVNELIPR